MLNSEVQQLELLASIDEVRGRVQAWAERPTDWLPVRRAQSLLQRVIARVETLRVRMEAPLVVATFGGTGTGKSSLVNALVGAECTRSGRQRPTTKQPILIAHPQTDLSDIGIPLEDVEVVQRDADLLRDVIILDCPDPDTSEGDTPGSNLDRLRTLLPHCDVLLYVSTQQKYRSARVADELASAASGCRMIFVQTHADLDEDIRDDWRQTLASEYAVPEVYFVDSVRAMQEQQAGHRPSGDMGRLMDLLRNKLGASERLRVRRANVLDLLQAGLVRCQEILSVSRPELTQLNLALAEQRQDLSRRLAEQLQKELLSSQGLWERRLIAAVVEQWNLSPFAWVLRTYNGLGGILASMTFFRVRSTAQLALLGTVQGVRWLEGKRKERLAEDSLQRVSHFTLTDSLLREAEIVIEGHVASAEIDRQILQANSLDELRQRAADVEQEFVSDASRRIDDVISELSRRNSRWGIRFIYEILFIAYIAFVLYRMGKNFFYDSLVRDADFLSTEFYVAAGLFLLLWCGLLVLTFTRRLRRGLTDRIRKMAAGLVESKLGRGLFPNLEAAVRSSEQSATELDGLLVRVNQLRHDLAEIGQFGARQVSPVPHREAPALP